MNRVSGTLSECTHTTYNTQHPTHPAPGEPLQPYNRLEAMGRWLVHVLLPHSHTPERYVACVQIRSHEDTLRHLYQSRVRASGGGDGAGVGDTEVLHETTAIVETHSLETTAATTSAATTTTTSNNNNNSMPDELFAVVTQRVLLIAHVSRDGGFRARTRCVLPLAHVEQAVVAGPLLTVVQVPLTPVIGWGHARGALNPLQPTGPGGAGGSSVAELTSLLPPLLVCRVECVDTAGAATLHAAVVSGREAVPPSVLVVRRVRLPAMALLE